MRDIEKTIVVLGDQWYEFVGSGSPKYAVDTLFKCSKVLKKDFSRASKNVWGYIQKYIYLLPLRGENSAVDTLNTKIITHKNLLKQKEKKKLQTQQEKLQKSQRKRKGTDGAESTKGEKKKVETPLKFFKK